MGLRQGASALGRSLRANSGWASRMRAGEPAITNRHQEGARIAPEGARFASLQQVKQRMRSVRSTAKITKAMKMVAASRLKGVQNKCEQSRGSIKPMTRLLGDLPATKADKTVTVAITSDRGLCGAINTYIVKHARVLDAVATEEDAAESEVVSMGEKGRAQLLRLKLKEHMKFLMVDVTRLAPSFSLAASLGDQLLEAGFDKAHIVFNRFQSAISFKPTVATVLSPSSLDSHAEETGIAFDGYELEGPERNDLLQNLCEFQLGLMLHNNLLENSTSEVASRMQAMENSTKSANDVLDKLQLTYNRTRQAAITTELSEIVSGAAAISG